MFCGRTSLLISFRHILITRNCFVNRPRWMRMRTAWNTCYCLVIRSIRVYGDWCRLSFIVRWYSTLYVININIYSIFIPSSFKFLRRWEKVDCINVTQNRDDLADVNTAMSLLYPYNEQNFWTSWRPSKFSHFVMLTDEWCVRQKHSNEHMPHLNSIGIIYEFAGHSFLWCEGTCKFHHITSIKE